MSKQRYVTCSVKNCFECPFCEKRDDMLKVCYCSRTGKMLETVYSIPEWCDLSDVDIYNLKSCVLCEYYDLAMNCCSFSGVKVLDRKNFCENFELAKIFKSGGQNAK